MIKNIIIISILLMISGCSSQDRSESDNSVSGDHAAVTDSGTYADYTQANGLTVLPFGDTAADGVVYYDIDPVNFSKTVSCNITAGQIQKISEGGFITYTVPLIMTMPGEYTGDCVSYTSAITPSVDLADRYTGLVIPVSDAVGDAKKSLSMTINGDEAQTDISFECDVDSYLTEFVSSDDDHICDIVFDVTYTITVPDDYDGLLLKITPVRNYYDTVSEDAGNVTTEIYITDNMPDGTVLMEIN